MIKFRGFFKWLYQFTSESPQFPNQVLNPQKPNWHLCCQYYAIYTWVWVEVCIVWMQAQNISAVFGSSPNKWQSLSSKSKLCLESLIPKSQIKIGKGRVQTKAVTKIKKKITNNLIVHVCNSKHMSLSTTS